MAGSLSLNACAIVASDSISCLEAGRASGLVGLWVLSVVAGATVWILSAVVAVVILRIRAKA